MSDIARSWHAGAAAAGFPVPAGTPMAGYMARVGPSAGTLDELTVGALVLRHADRRLAIVAADVVAVDASLTAEVAAAAGLERSELALCASHTHSGPAGIIARLHSADPAELDPDLRDRFVETCAAVVREATARPEPVELLVGEAELSGVAANRNDPNGPYDPRLTVLAPRRRDGSFAAVLVHAACHPTVLSAANHLVSADFPGALRRSLAAKLAEAGCATPVLFANGAAGDVSTRFTRQGQDSREVERVGEAMAAAAMEALRSARPIEGTLQHASTVVPLTSRSFDGIDELLAGPLDEDAAELPAVERRRLETRRQGAALLARLRDAGPGAVPASLQLDAWRLGDLALLAMPGELFASLGQAITGTAPVRTLILGYTNGYAGYLADSAAYAAETYEALASPYAPGTGEAVAEAAVTLLRSLPPGI